MPKASVNQAEIQAKTGVMLLYSYLAIFVSTLVIFYLASLLAPRFVVLGNISLTLFWSLILSAGVLAMLDTAAIPLVYYREWTRGRNFSRNEWMMLYFLLNVAGVWLIAHFANIYGLGIARWYVAVLLGIVLDFVQGLVMTSLGRLVR